MYLPSLILAVVNSHNLQSYIYENHIMMYLACDGNSPWELLLPL